MVYTFKTRVLLINLFLLVFVLIFADLQDGELIHGENFSLFAAMSALEVLILSDCHFCILII